MHAVIDAAVATEYVVMTREEAVRVAFALQVAICYVPAGEGRDTLRELLAAHVQAFGLTRAVTVPS